jgi:hypothetical protein
MSKLLISKLSHIGPDAAWNYLLDPHNSLGKEKKKPIFSKRKKLKIFGPPNSETTALLKSLSIKRKPTFWNVLIAAAEQERRKELSSVSLCLDEPEDGEWVEENPLTEEQFINWYLDDKIS